MASRRWCGTTCLEPKADALEPRARGPRALHHVAVGARDVDSLARFYAEAFDLEELARHTHADGSLRSVWLRAGEVVIMVEGTSVNEPRVDGIGRGPFLLAFRIEADERAALEERLLALGVSVETRSAHSAYFRDPEGNRIALSDYPVPASAANRADGGSASGGLWRSEG